MPKGRPKGSKQDPELKPFKVALALEAKLAEDGEVTPANIGSLRYIARQLLERAGADTNSSREVADRIDGKTVTQIEAKIGIEVKAVGHRIVDA